MDEVQGALCSAEVRDGDVASHVTEVSCTKICRNRLGPNTDGTYMSRKNDGLPMLTRLSVDSSTQHWPFILLFMPSSQLLWCDETQTHLNNVPAETILGGTLAKTLFSSADVEGMYTEFEKKWSGDQCECV